LLATAGYPEGEGFPTINLVVNRNDAQVRIARAVARMWQVNLNVETDVIIKETADLADFRRIGEYDLIRRGVVFPTDNSVSNLSLIFNEALPVSTGSLPASTGEADTSLREPAEVENDPAARRSSDRQDGVADDGKHLFLSYTEEQALIDLYSIPLYFPTSYFLVKPYIKGFEPNGLDAYDLRNVEIDRSWRPVTRP
jgi:oligopeptide transport system substrate-binding protein